MFITGLIIFFGIHLVPFFPKTKTSLRTRFGENPYMGTFFTYKLNWINNDYIWLRKQN